jgi:hypothetical protein
VTWKMMRWVSWGEPGRRRWNYLDLGYFSPFEHGHSDSPDAWMAGRLCEIMTLTLMVAVIGI